jgi:DNA-binding MarR family transcriptional regulator
MAVKFKLDNPQLSTWLLLHQTHNLVVKVEDAVFAKMGISNQKHAVLMAMKYIEGPVTPSDIAHWLDRNTNTITTLVDRMEKSGLVRRQRDLRDRRSVRLVMTRKGKETLKAATRIGWEVVQEVLEELSEDELRALSTLLETVRSKAFDYLNPGKVMEEAKMKYQ